MRFLSLFLVLVVGLTLSGCSKFYHYDGPEVTRVLVYKTDRRVMLLHDNIVLESYKMDLGFAPVGHKQFRGDGKTPEGNYIIDRRNPNSEFHLSIGINYPNAKDVAYASSQGKNPGGDIFIHGQPERFKKRAKQDWTAGCIAVSNTAMRKIYSMVKNGTPITIFP